MDHPSARGELLGQPAPAGYVDEWTARIAKPKDAERHDFQTAVVFRVGSELLALPTAAVREVAEPRQIHSLPHRRGGAVIGVVNIRGELLVCAALAIVLNVDMDGAATPADGGSRQRMLVLQREDVRVACPVDDVAGVHRYRSADLRDVPATIARAALKYSSRLLTVGDRTAGLLDAQLVFAALRRGVA